MSKESSNWLNNNTLIGFTEKRGKAWHYRESEQGKEPNHYPQAVPVDDVLRRLFHWKAEPTPIFVQDKGGRYVEVPGRVAIVRNDTQAVLSAGLSDRYAPHQYREWLITNVANILDDELGIGSAGLLRGGAQAWVSVEVPENIKTPEGIEFRPNLIAATSFDGSIATTYKRVVTNTVCDNTMAAALGEAGQEYRVRHTRHSAARIGDARSALAVVHSMGEDFAAQVKRLCEEEVSPKNFDKVLDRLIPMPEKDGRSKTLAEHKREEIVKLYKTDERVTPWKGTAFGVLQAFNTYDHHVKTVRNAERAERNFANMLGGATEDADRGVVKVIEEVIAG